MVAPCLEVLLYRNNQSMSSCAQHDYRRDLLRGLSPPLFAWTSIVQSNVRLSGQEEDFTSQLYHRELLPRVPIAGIYFLLADGLSYNATASIPPEMKGAIEKRLIFRRSILQALEEDTGPLRARTKASLSCLSMLRGVRETFHLGRPVKEAFSTKIQRSFASSVPPRPMVTIDFPCALSHLETLCNDAADVDQFLDTKTGEDLSTAIEVLMSRIPQPSAYIRALVQSFLMDRESHKVLGRLTPKQFLLSSLVSVVLPNSQMLDPANDLVEAPNNPRFQMARLVTEFDAKVDQQYINIFRGACLNRCRTRRNLCHLVLDWDALQADAEDLDERMREFTAEQPALYASDRPTFAYPLSSWVYHHKLVHLRHIIQLGFELSIYAPDENAGMYWYLSYICGTHVSHIDRISFFLDQDMQLQDSLAQRADAARPPDANSRGVFRRTLNNLFRLYTHLKATDAFSRALHALYTLLLRHETITIPPRPYSSDKLRYELRMKPFLSLNVPDPVTFEIFQEESSFQDLSDGELLEEATTRIGEAKRFWEEVLKAGWSAEPVDPLEGNQQNEISKNEARKGCTTVEGEWSRGMKNVMRACIATSICIATLKKRSGLGGDMDLSSIRATIPVPGEKECWHNWWLVPRLSDGG
jgi:N-alpha-acetyltransferase 35, NatC auxiliary subunit